MDEFEVIEDQFELASFGVKPVVFDIIRLLDQDELTIFEIQRLADAMERRNTRSFQQFLARNLIAVEREDE